MLRRVALACALLWLGSVWAQTTAAPVPVEPPRLIQHVTDTTGTLTAEQIAQLEAQLHARPEDDTRLKETHHLAATLRARLKELQTGSRGNYREYTTALSRWESSRSEAVLRDQLTPELRSWEDSARTAAAQRAIQRRVQTTNHPAPQQPTPRSGPSLR